MDQWSRRGWSKWAGTFFKRDKPLGSEPWFNPEAVTEQKREWIEQQEKVQGVQEAAWPEHIYENFFIVGLPPDMELTQVAEQLCDLERKKRSDSDNEPDPNKEHLQPPQPSFTPQVLLRMPPGAPAPISDDEVAALCFPSGVAPEKLKRTPSLSALDELVMGRDSDQQQQCNVFMLKVGGNFPLYGCCWYVREMLHRPPYLARQEYRSCRAPFRQCMIAAPRCYCLLSHFPFFDLHFRVLKIVLDLERLERLLEYDSEKSKLRPPGPNLLSPGSPKSHAAAAGSSRRSLHEAYSAGGSAPSSQPGSLCSSLANSRAPSPLMGTRPSRGSAAGAGHLHASGSSGGAAAADGRQPAELALPARKQTPDSDVQAHVVHNRQLYCAECAGIIEDMCPFTPGADAAASIASPPSWSQWQQQRQQRAHSLLGPDSYEAGVQQEQQQDRSSPSPFEAQQESSTPSEGCTARCEVCGKRLHMSTTDGLLPDSSQPLAAATGPAAGAVAVSAAAADGVLDASRSSKPAQTSIVGALTGVLPASISAALQSVSSTGSQAAAAAAATNQQQAQQFDAVAAAAADFDAAGSKGSGAQPTEWARWQGVVSAVRGAHGSQQLSHGGGSTNSLGDAGLTEACSTPGHETSMVQRMWETWAPKALEGSPAEAGNTGGSGRLSGGLGIFKRPSRASSSLVDQLQASARISRNSSPATEAPSAVAQVDQPQELLQQQGGQQQGMQQLQQAVDGVQGAPPPQKQQQQKQQREGLSIQPPQQQQQQHLHGSHGPSRLRPGAAQSTTAAVTAAAATDVAGAWQGDPNLRPLRSFKGYSEGGASHVACPEGLRDISTTSNASFYSVDDEPAGSATQIAEAGQIVHGQGLQQQEEGQQPEQQQQQQLLPDSRSAPVLQPQQPQQQQALRQRGKSEVLMRRPSPPAGQLPVVQLNGRRQQRWSDPASWPSRPRTPSPLPVMSAAARASHGGRPAGGSTGGDSIVSAFAAIAAAAEPFEGAVPRLSAHPSTSSSLNAGELLSNSSAGSELEAAAAAVVSGPVDSVGDAWDSSSQGGGARVNVTIGGGMIPSADSKLQVQLQPLVMQPPSRAGSGRRSALFEEVALRRSGDMSNELRMTISHLVQVDSSTLLAAYYASPIPQPGETYRLMLGDLYRLEFERSLPLQQYAPPGRSKLRHEVLTYAEVECAQQLQLWTVAALCRSLSVENIITLVNAALLEKQLVVFCPHIGTLGSIVLALVPLLRPFTWQSLVMPVTPVNMLGFLDAPVPFVLGVQYKTPDVASRCHGLMRVNVYKDAIKNASFPAMPNTRQLTAALAPFHASLREAAPLAVERPVHVITPDEEEAAQGFLGVMHDYLSKLCGDLRLHTIVNVGMSKRTGVFMKESLLESLPVKDRAFMRAFMETQMFAAYADGVISDYCEA